MGRNKNLQGEKKLYRPKVEIYNDDTKNIADIYNEEEIIREEEVIMTELIEKINNLQIPPHIMRELGLKKDWQKKISPEFKERVVKTALRHKELLRELSKY